MSDRTVAGGRLGEPVTDLIEVTVGAVAHGGHCVARHEGRVVFVRHALPGERVRVRITDTSHASFWRGETVDVLDVSPDRVTPPCPVAGECGGCDFQHIALPAQRALKTDVVREQVRRLAGIEWDGEVEAIPVPGRGDDGLAWRTRMQYVVDAGRVGLRGHRSHNLVEIPGGGCPISTGPDAATLSRLAGGARTLVVARGDTETTVVADGTVVAGPEEVTQTVGGHEFRVDPTSFWQVHPSAADVLTRAVLDALDPRPGEFALDLYCGAGLFAAALSAAGAQVIGIESDKAAVSHARRWASEARYLSGPVERVWRKVPPRTDLVVLDPPRAGAGKTVVPRVAALGARSVALVSCDPAALGRDLGLFARHGYQLAGLRGFDLFPMTHHVECVALLTKSGSDHR